MAEASAPALTKETLQALAQAQGLALSPSELESLLPLVRALRAMMDELAEAPLADVEPTSVYRML